eukprot:14204525-Ditylum_brightwellii.AAC.1
MSASAASSGYGPPCFPAQRVKALYCIMTLPDGSSKIGREPNGDVGLLQPSPSIGFVCLSRSLFCMHCEEQCKGPNFVQQQDNK